MALVRSRRPRMVSDGREPLAMTAQRMNWRHSAGVLVGRTDGPLSLVWVVTVGDALVR